MIVTREARFVTVEGGEGAGKSTVLGAVRDALAINGRPVVSTREPGGTPMAERIRDVLLDPAHAGMCAEAELLLMFAARAQHVREVIAPALADGAWVLSDRFTDSSYAYQGAGRGLGLEFIAELERRVVGISPGLTLLLDIGVGEGRARARGRGGDADRIEAEQDGFFERVRDGFLARASADPDRVVVLDATRPPDDVAQAAQDAVAHYRLRTLLP